MNVLDSLPKLILPIRTFEHYEDANGCNQIREVYSKGGSHNKWGKFGKVWHNIGGVKNHLHTLQREVLAEHMNGYMLVKITEGGITMHPIKDLIIATFKQYYSAKKPWGKYAIDEIDKLRQIGILIED